jgi:hypothetical protein
LPLSRIAATRRHVRDHDSASATKTPADAAVAAALDRLLDPLESLNQEEFQSEGRHAARTEAASNPVLDTRLDGDSLPWLEALAWCFGVIVVCAAVVGTALLFWLTFRAP